MNRHITVGAIAALLIAAICIAGCTSSTSPSNQTTTANVTQTSNATQNATSSATINASTAAPISVQQGENFTLQLQSNPSTGYKWTPSFDTSVITLENQHYVAAQPVTPGSGGNDVFTFRAVQVGSTTITFDHVSPSGTVTDRVVNDVTVTQAATPQVSFTVSLPTNPSTGYHWQPTYDTSTLNLKSSTFEASGSQIGAAGTQVITFQVLQTGTATATFDNLNPSGSSTQQISVAVTVTQAATPQVSFTVSLPTNPSTGYHWQPTYDTSTLNLKSSTFEASGSQIGAAGTQVITFQVLQTGTATATFDNLNPSGSSTQQISVAVTSG
jgi:predicted secreted protein